MPTPTPDATPVVALTLTPPEILTNTPVLDTPSPTRTLRPPTPILTITPLPSTPLLEEDFDDFKLNEWDLQRAGTSRVIETSDENHVLQLVWQGETGGAELRYTLPSGIIDYAFEASVMQVTGSGGLIGLMFRNEPNSPCDDQYKLYLDITGNWLNLVQGDGSICDENRITGLFSNRSIELSSNKWYVLRVEAQGSEIRAYLDGVFITSDQDESLSSNVIGIWGYGGENGQHEVYFDDIRVWSLNGSE
ncbi:MAG: hypothetical protein F9K28_11565 [Bacteroidetes bacterium]|nr:MAG: hypothetical protein F9K28_11565 [Bacteroidota bacterium]